MIHHILAQLNPNYNCSILNDTSVTCKATFPSNNNYLLNKYTCTAPHVQKYSELYFITKYLCTSKNQKFGIIQAIINDKFHPETYLVRSFHHRLI